MSLRIGGSGLANGAVRKLNTGLGAIRGNFEGLSSGKRSSNAADLAVALTLLARSDTGAIAARNISDSVSVANVADGALQTASDITLRLEELSVQAANGILSDGQRDALDQEYQQLKQELDRTGLTTQFAGQKLLDGSGDLSVQSGTEGNATSNLSLPTLSSEALGLPDSISTPEQARAAIDATHSASEQIVQDRADIGVQVTRLEATLSNLGSRINNESAAGGRSLDVDFAREVSNLIAAQIQANTNVGLLAQANGNERNAAALLT